TERPERREPQGHGRCLQSRFCLGFASVDSEGLEVREKWITHLLSPGGTAPCRSHARCASCVLTRLLRRALRPRRRVRPPRASRGLVSLANTVCLFLAMTRLASLRERHRRTLTSQRSRGPCEMFPRGDREQ